MNSDFAAAMRRAASATRQFELPKATRIIRDAIAGGLTGRFANPEKVTELDEQRTKQAARLRQPLGEVLRTLQEGRRKLVPDGVLPGLNIPGMKARKAPPPIADGAQFLTRSFSCDAGTRMYKLYIPVSARDRPRGLVLMLHGCTQDPDDFATGTNMNVLADTQGLLVAYPGQPRSANGSSCWNWFNPPDQMRDAGEPSILAGIARTIASDYQLDRCQVFTAGFSAGGAMAAVLAETYPDVFSAVGIHSGLAYRSANDVISAFAIMRGDAGPSFKEQQRPGKRIDPRVRMIVFQGTADQTVHPSNAARIIGAAHPATAAEYVKQDSGRSPGGQFYKRTINHDEQNVPVSECWLVDGAQHAWSGGHPSGSFTDPHGPDASSEMVRFFLNEAECLDRHRSLGLTHPR
jgi:poly(hydroxyalkanoate) depolymerase family esterase